MFLLALTSALFVEAPLIPAFFKGDALYDFCTREDDAQCLMYVAGALDGLFYVRFTDGSAGLCPTRMTNREAAALVVDHMDKNPADRERAGAAVVRMALAHKLDCDREVAAKD